MHHFTVRFLSGIAMSVVVPLLALALSLPGAIHAGQHRPSDQGQVVSDGELENFARAYKKINDIRADYEARLRQVQDPQRAQELQQQAQIEMVRALEEEGLTVEKYNAMFVAVQNNEELRQKFNDIWKELAKQS